MKILHITETHSPSAGGVTTVVHDLLRFLSSNHVDNTLVTIGGPSAIKEENSRQIDLTPSSFGSPWGWNSKLRPTIEKLCDDLKPDLVHLHGAWLAPQVVGARVALRRRVPFVVTFHGMLEPYHWGDRGLVHRLKKELFWRLIAKRAYSRAAAVHAITALEAQTLRRLLSPTAIEIIPNAVDLSSVDEQINSLGNVKRERVIAFLGRLHPKKGVDLLIDAFSMSSKAAGWRLVIAGPPGPPDYRLSLQRRVESAPSDRQINFIGTLRGKDLWRFLRTAWCVVVPSQSEVVAMVNLEAAGCETFTITTPNTGLTDWEDGGGILAGCDVKSLTSAVETVCAMDYRERSVRGVNSRSLVARKYSWDVVGPQWLALYRKLLQGAAQATY